MTIHITRARKNIFEDLGFDADTAKNRKLRADLMIAIRKIVEDRKLKQTAAATLLGTTQPRISDLMRGEIDEFTIDSLVNMLSHAGVDVELRLDRTG